MNRHHQQNSSAIRSLKVSLLTFICLLTLVPLCAQAQKSDILPLCELVVTGDEWNALEPAVSLAGSPNLMGNGIKKGLHFECASQLRQGPIYEDQDGRLVSVGTFLKKLPTGRAVPDTIRTIDGDKQRVHLSVDAPGRTGLGSCIPGWTLSPTDLCPESIFDGLDGGVMIWRKRHKDGTFTSNDWTVSRDIHPGFVLRKNGECLTRQSGCEYEVVFVKDEDGEIVLDRDVQVLIQVAIHLDELPEPGLLGYSSTMAIPLLIKAEDDDGLPEETPTATPDASPAPSVTPDGETDAFIEANTQINEMYEYFGVATSSNKGLSKLEKQQKKQDRKTLKGLIRDFKSYILSNPDLLESCSSLNKKKLKKLVKRSKRARNSKRKWNKILRIFKKMTECFNG